MYKAQKGFTLIELVVVITILGILAAFAFPRFAALEVEARKATVDGLAGSLRSAASLAHSLAIAQATAAIGPVTMEGNSIDLVFHYPNTTDIPSTLVDYSGFTWTDATPAAGSSRFVKTGATTAATCSVTYAESTGAGVPPTITPATGGC